jgi:protein-L-isoaspartate(D-aspartate) O-methyltransferase
LAVIYYDKERKVAGTFVIGNFRGTFDWRAFEDKVRVPPLAREAILRIGLHGATGEISFDQVKLEAGK